MKKLIKKLKANINIKPTFAVLICWKERGIGASDKDWKTAYSRAIEIAKAKGLKEYQAKKTILFILSK